MEGGLDYLKTPLLLSSDESEKPSENERVQKSNSFTPLKCEFLSKLPEKIRSGLNPEALLHLDLTKMTGLVKGNSESLSCLFIFILLIFCFLFYIFL